MNAILSQKWVEHFSELHSADNNENEKNNVSTKHRTNNKKKLFLNLLSQQTKSLIAVLKNQKASGSDSISNEIIKASALVIVPFLVAFLNSLTPVLR